MSSKVDYPVLPPFLLENVTDFHTHTPGKPNAIININPGGIVEPGLLYSVGIHPWDVDKADDSTWQTLQSQLLLPEVVAVGECGLDKIKGPSLEAQIPAFCRHIELSETIGKPLIIHCVRAVDTLEMLRNRYRPTQPWIFHGFRGKPQQARQLISRGYYLSIKPSHIPTLPPDLPRDRILFETD